MKICVIGMPSFYGGAGSELLHQIKLWSTMGLETVVIPASQDSIPDYQTKAWLDDQNAKILPPCSWGSIEQDDVAIGYCSRRYLECLPLIIRHTSRTVFVNCMTAPFAMEKDKHKSGLIALSLYQREAVMASSKQAILETSPQSPAEFMVFVPYFDAFSYDFKPYNGDGIFALGHLSRAVPQKFRPDTLDIYDRVQFAGEKRGIFLGWNAKCEEKIGRLPQWINAYPNHHSFSVPAFFYAVDVLLQTSECPENLPRVAMEAMASGTVVVAPKAQGWQDIVANRVTGCLCETADEFAECATMLGRDPQRRVFMALRAQEAVVSQFNRDVAALSWGRVFERLERI